MHAGFPWNVQIKVLRKCGPENIYGIVSNWLVCIVFTLSQIIVFTLDR